MGPFIRSAAAVTCFLALAVAGAVAQQDEPQAIVNVPLSFTPADEAPVAALSVSPRAAARVPAAYQNILALHNKFRATHQVTPLAWNARVARDAKNWARNCVFNHDSTARGKNEGENLYVTTLTNTAGVLSDAINAWYKEVGAYSFSNPGFSYATGHFTQVVWKGTAQLGCAAQSCPGIIPGWSTGTLVVCRYSPPGNYNTPDEFRKNVLPARP